MLKLRYGLRKKIENGKNTDMWTEPWLCNLPLSKWITYINPNELDKFKKVNELTSEGMRNVNVLENCFGSLLIQRIVAILIDENEGVDRWIWEENWKGCLTVKNAYCHLRSIDNITVDTQINWRDIWRLNVSQRVKMFIWKFLWGRLPTSDWFGKFSGCEADKCYLCKEETDHLFFNCKVTKDYWELVERMFNINFRYKQNWSAYNETIQFKKNDISIETEKVKKFSENINHDYITLLCDAAWKGGLKAGCGFLIEDADGNILEKGSSIEIATNPLYAEAKAIWVGLDNVRKKNMRRIQGLTVIDWLEFFKAISKLLGTYQ
ncbi:hypothetical protein Cni_G17175 [Canna indica]|uniref:Reverse transcriptase zinc-binding domain-containing protein n=1 Tax=Canna indica TaxID=4628 RepID=A0AAQ3KI60_9LILI|nr:hypothetical protein Cni_G17175 [Canna indica]